MTGPSSGRGRRARLLAVCVGAPRTVTGRSITTGIWKQPVRGAVRAHGTNLEGDGQADRRVHGGPDKAIYAYAGEDSAWWSQQLDRPIEPGTFGENLLTADVDVTGARIGEQWRVGTVLLEVRQPRLPCFKLGLRMGAPTFVRTFAQAGRPGAYLAILTPGELRAGDRVEIVSRPDHDVTVGLFAHAVLNDRSELPTLLAARALPLPWRELLSEPMTPDA